MQLPPGEYELKVFHERATEQTLEALTRRIRRDRSGRPADSDDRWFQKQAICLAPHKNKYGNEYSPRPDDQVIYPGVETPGRH